MARVHVLISGRVQGVYFRYYTRQEAQKLNVKGWVRNLADGRVEAVFEGPVEKLKTMIEWCHKGSPRSHVENVEVLWEEKEENYTNFSITG